MKHTKTVALFLTICLLLGTFSIEVSALDFDPSSGYDASGKCGDAITWSVKGYSPDLSITGSGRMYDYGDTLEDHAPWVEYAGVLPKGYYLPSPVASVTFSEGITYIGANSFYGCEYLKSVNFPSSLTEIANEAFYGCPVGAISLPNSIKRIGYDAFAKCGTVTVSVSRALFNALEFNKSTEVEKIFRDTEVEFNITEDGAPIIAEESIVPVTGVKIEPAEISLKVGESATLRAVITPENATNKKVTWWSSNGLVSVEDGRITLLTPQNQGFDDDIVWCETEDGSFRSSCAITVLQGNTQGDDKFTDVPDTAYYAEPVKWAVEKGITAGTSAMTFSPNQSCTRAQAVTFLWRAAGSPRVSGSTGFSDVPSDAYYADAVKWAVKEGITSGTGGGKFSPNVACTRAQIVTFLYRAAGSPSTNSGIEVATPLTDQQVAARLVDMQKAFPNGKYWNYKNGTAHTLYTVTDHPTDGVNYIQQGACITFADFVTSEIFHQEYGRILFDYSFAPRNTHWCQRAYGWYFTNVEDEITRLEPGDIIDVVTPTFQHMAVVWKVNGDYFQVAEEWSGSADRIHWGDFNGNSRYTSLAALKAAGQVTLFKHPGAKYAPNLPVAGFSDVTQNAYYADAVKWAVQNEITSGTSAGKFSPNATCTRAQIVTFLYRDVDE